MQGRLVLPLTVIIAILCNCGCNGEHLANVVGLGGLKQQEINPPGLKPAPKVGISEGRDTATNQEKGNKTATYKPSDVTKKEETHITSGDTEGQDISIYDAMLVKVLVAEEDSIALVDLSTTKRMPLFLEWNNTNVYSIDFHWNKSLIFFAANNTIYSIDLMSRGNNYTITPIVLQRVKGSVRLAVDWIHDKLYWLCDYYQTIEMADLDGNNRRPLIDNIKPFQFPNNIVVDPFEGVLFFVSDYALFKSDLNGKHIRHVTLDLNERGKPGMGIRHIALDRENKTIYLTGKTPQTKLANSTVFIMQVTYNGNEVVNNLLASETKWTDIYSMDVFHDTLYFANYNQSQVDSIYKFSLTKQNSTPELLYVPRFTDNGIWSIRVRHPCVQLLQSSECKRK